MSKKHTRSSVGDLFGALWRNSWKTFDDHRFQNRDDEADLIDADEGYTRDYKDDVRNHVDAESKEKLIYDNAWEETNEEISDRRKRRKDKTESLRNEARNAFKNNPHYPFQGKRHGVILYDGKPVMGSKEDTRLRAAELRRHNRIVGKYRTKTMRERIRKTMPGQVFGHGVFVYDKKNDMSKLYIEEVYVNGNGQIYDILLKCGQEQLHATPDKLKQWQAEGYTLMNPEKLY